MAHPYLLLIRRVRRPSHWAQIQPAIKLLSGEDRPAAAQVSNNKSTRRSIPSCVDAPPRLRPTRPTSSRDRRPI